MYYYFDFCEKHILQKTCLTESVTDKANSFVGNQ